MSHAPAPPAQVTSHQTGGAELSPWCAQVQAPAKPPPADQKPANGSAPAGGVASNGQGPPPGPPRRKESVTWSPFGALGKVMGIIGIITKIFAAIIQNICTGGVERREHRGGRHQGRGDRGCAGDQGDVLQHHLHNIAQ